MLVQLEDGSFVEAAVAYGLDSLRDGRGLAISDFDGDGDLDMIINNYNRPAHYFVNRTTGDRHWLQVRLRGRDNNRDGVGALVEVRSGALRLLRAVTAGDSYASQSSKTVHFGLAHHDRIDELIVTWPNRERQTFRGLGVDRVLQIDEDRDDLNPLAKAR